MNKIKKPKRLYRVKRESVCLGERERVLWTRIVSASSASAAVLVSLGEDEKEWIGKPIVPKPPDVASLQPPKFLRKEGTLSIVRSERLSPWEARAFRDRVRQSKAFSRRKKVSKENK